MSRRHALSDNPSSSSLSHAMFSNNIREIDDFQDCENIAGLDSPAFMADLPAGDEAKGSDLRWSARQLTPWMRIRKIFALFSSRDKSSKSDTDDALPLLSSSESSERLIERPRRRVGKFIVLRWFLSLLVGIFVML